MSISCDESNKKKLLYLKSHFQECQCRIYCVSSERDSNFHTNDFRKAILKHYPTGIYLFKVNNRNTRTMHEICSKLTIKIPEQCRSLLLTLSRFHTLFWCFIADFEQVDAGWVSIKMPDALAQKLQLLKHFSEIFLLIS